jgi:hypothetical protein
MAQEIIDVDYKEVYQAIALIEQFETLNEDFKNFVKTLPHKYKTEGEVHSDRLDNLLTILDSEKMSEEFEPLASSKLSGRQSASIVERLGISQELIRLRKEGATIAELAMRFTISTKSISRFFKYYDNLEPSKKAKVQRRSVFNTVDELEELMIVIKRNMARLEATDDENNIKLIEVLRKLIMDAANLSEKMANQERYQKFTEFVIRVLMDELPSKRTVILKQIQSAQGKATENLLGGY